MTNGSTLPLHGRVIERGGRRVLFAMATRAEYLDALAARFEPFLCGVGPVEAAAATATRLAASDADLVVSLGSAGSARLPQGHVAQVGRVAYRDMDASALGFAPGVTPFLDLPATVELAHRIPGVDVASLSTGAGVISGEGYSAIDADMVDMETWALMRACRMNNCELVALRAVSDGSKPLGGYHDWADHLPIVDRALADAVDRLFDWLDAGGISRAAAS